MKAGYIQFKPELKNIEANLGTMKHLIKKADAELLILPELANTGYTFSAKEELAGMAEPFDSSPTLDSLQKLAREKSCGLVVGFAESSGDSIFNSAALLRPDGSRELYRKNHLFGAENLFFKPGDIPFQVYDFNGVKLGIIVCFDWFFPESIRVLALQGAQIICHPVNFILPWGQRAMVIRCLENRVFAITANRYGTESFGDRSFTFTGASQITAPDGSVLASAPGEGDHIAVVDIDPTVASDKHINRFNDLFECRRTEFYGAITDSP
ncbi:MAG: beta-ureidopropionase [Candidatus Latescibacteria bacterium]|nr:beta-ureidopropionase [Candidatus Latescibacterota bacterium]